MAYCIPVNPETKIVPFNLKTSTIIPFDPEKSMLKTFKSYGSESLGKPDDYLDNHKNYFLICGCGVYSPDDPLSRFLELGIAKFLLDNDILKCPTCEKKIDYIPHELVNSQ